MKHKQSNRRPYCCSHFPSGPLWCAPSLSQHAGLSTHQGVFKAPATHLQMLSGFMLPYALNRVATRSVLISDENFQAEKFHVDGHFTNNLKTSNNRVYIAIVLNDHSHYYSCSKLRIGNMKRSVWFSCGWCVGSFQIRWLNKTDTWTNEVNFLIHHFNTRKHLSKNGKFSSNRSQLRWYQNTQKTRANLEKGTKRNLC